MYCKKCGKELQDNEAFCRYCGASQISQPQAAANTNASYQGGGAADGKAMGALVCGIIGLIISFFVPIVGIILGIIAMVMGNGLKSTSKYANIGFILGIVAIILSVIMWIVSAVLLASMFSFFM